MNASRDESNTGASKGRSTDSILPLVYAELRELARARLKRKKRGNTLQATGLVHEAYFRLAKGEEQAKWNSKGHFFAAAAEAMRRILVENARSKGRKKRGGELDRTSLSNVAISAERQEQCILDLDEALLVFENDHPKKATVLKLRYFAGLTHREISLACDISPSTVDNYCHHKDVYSLQPPSFLTRMELWC